MPRAEASGATDLARGPEPLVSVVVPVYNVVPYLRECLDSILGQSIGPGNLELVAVDDGSTDGSGAVLDEYAARHANVIVIHTPNSGGPGGPRNVGMARARGRYVFFVDGDDYLGVEALERVVAMAEKAGSDIVVTRATAVGRRSTRRADSSVLTGLVERASLRQVYQSANVHKLYRRSLLERSGLRFTEGIPGGEDGDFMARLYHETERISIVGDDDVYFLRDRPGSQTKRGDSADARARYLRRIERERFEVVAARKPPGPARDVLMKRHFKKVARMFGPRWGRYEPEDRRRTFEIGHEIVARWHTDRIERALPCLYRIRIHLLNHGRLEELHDIVRTPAVDAFSSPLVEGGRIYARYPHFRDGSGIPDRLFEITDEVQAVVTPARAEIAAGRLRLAGEAYLTLVGGTASIQLRRWPRGEHWSFPTTPVPSPLLRDRARSYPDAGFDLEIDLATAARGAPLPRGTWAVEAVVEANGIRRRGSWRIRRRGRRQPGVRDGAVVISGPGLYVTRSRELRLRIGRRRLLVATLERLEPLRARLARSARFGRRLIRVRLGR